VRLAFGIGYLILRYYLILSIQAHITAILLKYFSNITYMKMFLPHYLIMFLHAKYVLSTGHQHAQKILPLTNYCYKCKHSLEGTRFGQITSGGNLGNLNIQDYMKYP
jgi:hypothetical protein